MCPTTWNEPQKHYGEQKYAYSMIPFILSLRIGQIQLWLEIRKQLSMAEIKLTI